VGGQVQTRQQGQRQDGYPRAGETDGHRQDDPVVAAGGSDPLLGGGDGVAEPTDPPDTLAALVGQGVIDQQGDGAAEGQVGENEQANPMGQIAGRPGGAFKEVVRGIQAVASGAIRELVGVGIVGNAAEGVPAQAHDPGEQELAGSGIGG